MRVDETKVFTVDELLSMKLWDTLCFEQDEGNDFEVNLTLIDGVKTWTLFENELVKEKYDWSASDDDDESDPPNRNWIVQSYFRGRWSESDLQDLINKIV